MAKEGSIIGLHPKIRVTVAVTGDFDEARRLDMTRILDGFLSQFRDGGERWRQEVKGDQLLKQILRVEIYTDDLPD